MVFSNIRDELLLFGSSQAANHASSEGINKLRGFCCTFVVKSFRGVSRLVKWLFLCLPDIVCIVSTSSVFAVDLWDDTLDVSCMTPMTMSLSELNEDCFHCTLCAFSLDIWLIIIAVVCY